MIIKYWSTNNIVIKIWSQSYKNYLINWKIENSTCLCEKI